MSKVVQLWSKFLDKIETDVTLELEEIIFSKKHGHEICVMHLIGKNIFPKMTTDEILSNPKARLGLSKDDLITITRLDSTINYHKHKLKIVEFDRNGTILLENNYGERKRYSEKHISSDTELQDSLPGNHAHRIGYQVGFKEGLKADQQKNKLLNKIKKFKLFNSCNGN